MGYLSDHSGFLGGEEGTEQVTDSILLLWAHLQQKIIPREAQKLLSAKGRGQSRKTFNCGFYQDSNPIMSGGKSPRGPLGLAALPPNAGLYP